jgi:hypothetical protein
MHPEAATRLQVKMRANRFLWVYMVPSRKPSWFISTDRQEREVDARESASYLSEVWAVTGIACKIDDSPSCLDDESASKAMVEIVEPARREMLGGHVGYSCVRHFDALPPIEFDCRPDASLCKMAPVAKTGHRTRRPP